jgi:hypothetical protein
LHRLRTLVAGLAAATVVVSGLAASSSQAAPSRASARDDLIPAALPGTVRITQANLLSGQDEALFQADLAKILANKPDFLTYNEVPFRLDTNLAPPYYLPPDGSPAYGYSIYRAAPSGDLETDRYTRATPVAWRNDRWAPLATGTAQISNARGKDRGQSTELGVRFASWATLRGLDGQVVSIVSTHFAPEGTYSSGLTGPSAANLAALTTALSAAGPVLVGGDLNVQYRSAAYNAVPWATYGLTPTYDVVGSAFPTGDHFGNTIDYLFMQQAAQFAVQGQYSTVLNSDHNAVTADLAFTSVPSGPPAFFPGTVVNTPELGKVGRRAVLDLMVRAIDAAPEKARLQLLSSSFADTALYRSVKKAIKRGVKVQMVVGETRLTGKERNLLRKLGSTVNKRTFLVSCSTSRFCQRQVRTRQAPAAQLLLSQAGATSTLRIDADQPMANKAARNSTTATISTTASQYSFARDKFLKMAGRSGR